MNRMGFVKRKGTTVKKTFAVNFENEQSFLQELRPNFTNTKFHLSF
jgi:hypothetical protein